MAVNILTSLSQSQEIANAVLNKVKNKGYAVASDLGALASKDTVAKTDLAQALANEIDAKATSSDLSTVSGKVDTLIGSDTSKSVRTIANEELAAQLIPQNAQEALDTLGEIAAWIQDHPGEAAAINSKLTLGTHEVSGEQVQYNTVKAYVEAYVADQIGAAGLSGSNAIQISNNTVSLIVDTANANGLEITANGLKLNTVVASTNGIGGSNGAMTAAQAEKLAGLDNYTAGDGVEITGRSIAAKVDAANGLSVDSTDGIKMAVVVASTDGVGGSNGAMTAAQAEQLANIRVATSAEVTTVIGALESL